MKKKVKTHSKLFDTTVSITIDDKLSQLPVKGLVARKLKQANEQLKVMKTLPKV